MRQDGMMYSQTHEWVKTEGNMATIGITDFAVHQLSDLVYIDLPKQGQNIKSGEPFGEVESVKAVSDLYAPVSGEVVAINEKATSNLDVITNDPFGEGWLVKIKISSVSELSRLLSEQDYNKLKETDK